ncbi:MAG: ATP-binding cassette domain-containing protein, partial [Pseudomonadota bacterium]
MSFVEVEGLTHRYAGRPVLEGIALTAAEGCFVSIVGASGCGKSTFLRLLLAEERPTTGTIRIAGNPPAAEPGPDRGVVFQRYSVFPHMTVLGNLLAAEELSRPGVTKRLWGMARRAARARADAVLERIGLAAEASKYPAQLSGGQQQRLAIAQALAAKPRV